ncbi:MAG: GIY-YIG nuclease family protein [Methanomassiliicoccales archaeon]
MRGGILKGTYILIIEVPSAVEIKVGKLGVFTFEEGYYAYVGSAMNGLHARVRRHFSSNKKDHWHIDYLLRSARIVEAFIIPSETKEECTINEQLGTFTGTAAFPRGFGSSDCSCDSHLHRISAETLEEIRDEAKKRNWLAYSMPCDKQWANS